MELWDLYDENRNPLHRTHPRGTPLPEGTYHLAVIVVIVNSKGEVLLTRRAPEKAACPGWWENTGGSALAGETSRQAICRELREETGLTASPEEFTLLLQEDRRTDAHFDIYALSRDVELEEIRFQPGETDAARWVPLQEWESVAGTGTTLCPAREAPYKAELYRRLGEYLQGRREFPKSLEKENNMAMKVGMVSLGCAKNQVDGEMLLAALEQEGFQVVEDPEEADIALVNTCGFIDSAKRESIEVILELAQLKQEGQIQKLVVTGCLAERYREEIHRELPEVDGVFGIGANGDIGACVRRMLEEGFTQSFPEKDKMPLCGERELSTPGYFAYLKIAEGCDNRCAYCAIPLIRGGYRSRTMESIEEEARGLAEKGVKELVLIAQDTTRYGLDLYGEYSLAKLLTRLCRIDGFHWIRVLYCYPDSITDELLEVMAREEKVVKYMDIPLQHASGKTLRAMNRRGDRQSLTALMEKIREKVPGVVLRTTLITGFPGETEEDFTELAEFIRDVKFERMGCFPYSQEEDTPAAEFPDQVEEEVKEHRAEILMGDQMDIMDREGQRMVGKTLEVLVEGYDPEEEAWFGRSYRDAPDIDGKVLFTAGDRELEPGEFVPVEITACEDCDLSGRLCLTEA